MEARGGGKKGSSGRGVGENGRERAGRGGRGRGRRGDRGSGGRRGARGDRDAGGGRGARDDRGVGGGRGARGDRDAGESSGTREERGEGGSARNIMSRQNANAPALPPFSDFLLKRPFKQQHQMRKFILSALTNDNKDNVTILLGSELGLERVREIVGQEYVVHAGNRSHFYSFQRVAVPFCYLLIQVATHSCVAEAKRVITESCKEVKFFPNLISCLEQCHQSGMVDDRRADQEDSAYRPETIGDLDDAVFGAILKALRQVSDEAEDSRWPPLVTRLRALSPTGEAKDHLAKIADLVGAVTAKVIAQEIAKQRERVNHDMHVAQELQLGIYIERETRPPPGTLRVEGPRHDNDKEDFRSIRILPTKEEMVSREDPYLPLQYLMQPHSYPRGSEFAPTPVDRHLDIQFRLLREDMLSPLRRAVQALVNVGYQNLKPRQTMLSHNDVNGFGSVRCALFRNVVVEEIVPRIYRSAVCFNISFDHPDPSGGLGYWEYGRGSRLLAQNALLAIVFSTNREEYLFCKVSGKVALVKVKEELAASAISDEKQNQSLPKGKKEQKKQQKQQQNKKENLPRSARCVVEIQLADAVLGMQTLFNRKVHKDEEVLMLEVRSHFTLASEVALNALQQRCVVDIPFLPRIIPLGDDARTIAEREIRMPFYLDDDEEEYTKYDLRCLLKDDIDDTCEAGTVSQVRNILHQFQIRSFKYVCDYLEYLSKHDMLRVDVTQAAAVAAGLTREVALIQGPPGTGKTYVGVEIVRTLMKNSGGWLHESASWRGGENGVAPQVNGDLPAMFPILCICFTNHALDQFLEALLDSNIVTVDEVVRVGSRSKSERLALCVMQRGKETTEEYKRRKEIEERATRKEEEIRNCMGKLQKLQRPGNSLEDLTPYIEMYEDDVFDEMGNDEWQTQDKSIRGKLLHWWGSNRHGEGETLDQQLAQWKMNYVEILQEQIMMCIKEYDNLVDEKSRLQTAVSKAEAQKAKIVGITTTGCAMNHALLEAIRPRIVICEEAGEVMESHLLASLTDSTQSLILIGDHKQLRPKPAEYSLSYESGKNYDLDISLFERLTLAKMDSVMLHCQRRMAPEISEVLRKHMYDNLEDSVEVNNHPQPRGIANRVNFFDHDHHEEGEGEQGSSKQNKFEADMVVRLAQYFVRQGYLPSQIAVLTPYVGQILDIRSKLRARRMTVFVDERTRDQIADEVDDGNDDDNDEDDDDDDENVTEESIASVSSAIKTLTDCVRLSTVDNFQGEEAEIILISTVRNNKQGRLGFLKTDNRVNVMLSRAKLCMIVLGSSATVRKTNKNKNTLFARAIDLWEERGVMSDSITLRCEKHWNETVVRTPDEIPSDGGCKELCAARLSCGHTCRRLCHFDNPYHESAECKEKCLKERVCKHECNRPCGEPCGKCQVSVLWKKPNCGHILEIPCHKREGMREEYDLQLLANKIECTEMVYFEDPYELPCGHAITSATCDSVQANRFVCLEKCEREQPCGHPCENPCHHCYIDSNGDGDGDSSTSSGRTNHHYHRLPCSKKCERSLLCGHICDQTPCHPSSSCPPCTKQCSIHCEHSKCDLLCKAPCYPCNMPCGGWKSCKHMSTPCQDRCGMPCTRLPCQVQCDRKLKCGHECPSLCSEKCPDHAKACPQCAAEGKLEAHVADEIVDFVMYSALKEVKIAKGETSDSLLRFECGHVFTVGYMDLKLKMSAFYNYTRNNNNDSNNKMKKEDEEETISSVKKWNQIDEEILGESTPLCDLCKTPLSGVQRYERIMKWYHLNLQMRKWLLEVKTNYADMYDLYTKTLQEQSSTSTSRSSGSSGSSDGGGGGGGGGGVNNGNEGRAWTLSNSRMDTLLGKWSERAVSPVGLVFHDKRKLEELPSTVLIQDGFGRAHLGAAKLMKRMASLRAQLQKKSVGKQTASQKQKGKNGKGKGKEPAGHNNNNNKIVATASPPTLEKNWEAIMKRKIGEILQLCRDSKSGKLEEDIRNVAYLFLRDLFEKVVQLEQEDKAAKNATSSSASSSSSSSTRNAPNVEERKDKTKKDNTRQSYRESVEAVWLVCDAVIESCRTQDEGIRELLVALGKDTQVHLDKGWYQPVSAEEKKEVFKALRKDVGAGQGSFGGHWYTCPNGHIYCIGECGGAVSEAKCPDCGAIIGGGGHRLRGDNQPANDFLREVNEEIVPSGWREQVAQNLHIPDDDE